MSDIQFGDLEHAQPQLALRPDQDGHFVVAEVGEISAAELMIFVDLDVMRDMEAHASSNTRVELGGVMLGHQSIDDQGRPFVVISDSLRALHYEATKGSFKFTHDTWSQITRQRKEFRPDLEMVGWYHTHPGWNVFLSGMDLFICNNFFNRPLDVALVIDPCNDDRGWFQWTQSSPPVTNRTAGFYLTTGRFRQQELNHFARLFNASLYNKGPTASEPNMNDPRYSGGYGGSSQPIVNLMDNRKPIFELAVVAMLLIQFLLFSALAWKMLGDPVDSRQTAMQNEKALEEKMIELDASQLQQTRDQAYRDVLQSIVDAQSGEPSQLVQSFTDLKTSHHQLQSNVEAQMALAEKLTREKEDVSLELARQATLSDDLTSQVASYRNKLDATEKRLASLSKSVSSDDAGVDPAGGSGVDWLWVVLGGLATTLVGGFFGYLFGDSRQNQNSIDDSTEDTHAYGSQPSDPAAESGTESSRVNIVD